MFEWCLGDGWDGSIESIEAVSHTIPLWNLYLSGASGNYWCYTDSTTSLREGATSYLIITFPSHELFSAFC